MKTTIFNILKKFSTLWILLLAVGAFYLGLTMRTNHPAPPDHVHAAVSDPAKGNDPAHIPEKQVQMWTCSMHPQIRSPKPGKCPICGMDLIPVTAVSDSEDLGPREITLSARARKLAEIETSAVIRGRGQVTTEIRLPGKVAFDETRLGYITAWVGGRIDKMFVNFTGVAVKKGEPMVELYSPELVTTQEELFQAKKAVADLAGSSIASMKTTARETVEAVREKLRLLGLTRPQIAAIEASGQPLEHITINAPMSGVVIRRDATEGMYVQTGTHLYDMVDLSTVWVMLDAYESDLAHIRTGQTVTFETDTYPGRTFRGRVTFIDPVINPQTRTAQVRLAVTNTSGRLKPEMLVRAVVRAGIEGPRSPLLIPDTAPLITGRRAVVYVAVPEHEGTYQGREVVLGPKVGDHYVVDSGLREGEMVVTHGNFKIDSALQIMAKPSMMEPGGGAPPPAHEHGKQAAAPASPPSATPPSLQGLGDVFSAYLRVQQGLADDQLDIARTNARHLRQALDQVKTVDFDAGQKSFWKKEVTSIGDAARDLSAAADLDTARTAFICLSDTLIKVAKRYGPGTRGPLYEFHCPMANDNQGADWLQARPGVHNPYFGAAMPTCGEQTAVLPGGRHEH